MLDRPPRTLQTVNPEADQTRPPKRPAKRAPFVDSSGAFREPIYPGEAMLRLAAFVFMAVLPACVERDPIDAEVNLRASSVAAVPNRPGLDGDFERLNIGVPGFGGMFYDDNGDVVVHLTVPGNAEAARQKILERFGRSVLENPRTGQARGFRVRPARFEWHELTDIARRARTSVSTHDVNFVDIDEVTQQVVLGVPSAAAKAAVSMALAKQTLPEGSVVIRIFELPTLLQIKSVEDRQRPVLGGTRVTGSRRCTLSFNATLSGVRVVMTNAHCSGEVGAVETVNSWRFLYQHDANFPQQDRIGHEYADPAGFQCIPVGESTLQKCRYSDMAAYLVHDSVATSFPEIAWVGIYSDPKLYDSSWPMRIYGENASFVNSYVQKVGATTGYTDGTVLGTCADFGPYEQNYWYICQSYAALIARSGDSGSPVVAMQATMPLGYYFGVAFAADTIANVTYYAPMSGIHSDFPNLVTY